MSSQVRLRLLPRSSCLFDEPFRLKVSGLRSRQLVALTARSTDQKGVEFSSRASYRADGSGEVHLDRDPSLGGSYAGVEPMGLLWSMRPDSSHRKLVIRNSLHPHVVKFSVHEQDGDGRLLAEAANERLLIGDGVVRRPVRGEHFQGVLFTPPGEGPFCAVLDLSSYTCEIRPSLLASKGFVVLAVAVHSSKLVNMNVMHLDLFEEALNFLKKQPKVGSKGVGIVARSQGADVALSLAAFVPGVEAVVWINGCGANISVPLHYKNSQILSPLSMDVDKVIHTESGARVIKYIVGNPLAEENKGSVVPIEQATGQFLFVAAEDDLGWDSKAFMGQMVERLKSRGRNNFEVVTYPKAGHLLEAPYGPYCPSSVHGLLHFPVMWGGEPRFHAAAEVHLWEKVQEFLKTHLKCDVKSKL
ncbi:acyl-coenzyme A thioesterase 2, mitochondrial-like [Echeneis naucrates]|uniref:acyl-coenzyme A thioesterase 2, mitochondrial-like n=1 Tax=Echeneis naucrates TaxID=173247 RepID=UPI00111398A1|nr:acyl-coenzyme A thioesterase 2, mitochondrial-like [Echeneis naucrates]